MPLTLHDFGTPSAASTQIKLRGKDVTVRALSLFEIDHLRAMYPTPEAPIKRDPEKGSEHEGERDFQDPEYRAKVTLHGRELVLLESAVAVDYAPQPANASGKPLTFADAVAQNAGRQWVDGVLKEWRPSSGVGVITENELVAIRKAINELTNEESAPGN